MGYDSNHFVSNVLTAASWTFYLAVYMLDNVLKILVETADIKVNQIVGFIFLQCDMTSVSYTHLDVYKRQPTVIAMAVLPHTSL